MEKKKIYSPCTFVEGTISHDTGSPSSACSTDYAKEAKNKPPNIRNRKTMTKTHRMFQTSPPAKEVRFYQRLWKSYCKHLVDDTLNSSGNAVGLYCLINTTHQLQDCCLCWSLFILSKPYHSWKQGKNPKLITVMTSCHTWGYRL